MKQAVVYWLLAALAGPAALPGQGGASNAATSVTLFTTGNVLVRRTLSIPVPAGVSTQTLELGNLTPASLKPLGSGVTITRINSDATWSEDALLRRNIGRSFELLQPDRSRRRATLLSLDPEHWEWADGGVVFGRPGQVIWPKEIVPAARVVDVTIESDRARNGLAVMYETTGGAWFANYSLTLGSTGRLEGVATVSAGTLDLTNAEVQLFAGDLGTNRYQAVRPSVAPTGRSFVSGGVSGASGLVPRDAVSTKQTVNEAIGDAHVYTLPGRISFIAGTKVVLPIFDPVRVAVERRYIVSGALPYYGIVGRSSAEEFASVNVAYNLPHQAGTALGDLALPSGNVSIFDVDRSGRLQLIGQGSFDHTPPGAELLVVAGAAFDISARRIQTEYNATRSGQPEVTTAVTGYQVTLRNAKDSAVMVEVREDRGGEWAVIESSVPAERRSATRTIFAVRVPASGTATLTYRIRAVW